MGVGKGIGIIMELLKSIDSLYFREFLGLVSNYLIALCMGIFLLENVIALFIKEESDRHGVYWRQRFWMFVIHSLMFVDLTLATKNWNIVLIYGLIMVGLSSMILVTGFVYPKCNQFLLNNLCLLLGTGFCILSRLSLQNAMKQFIIVMISYIICLLIPWLVKKLHTKMTKMGWIFGLLGLFMLSVVLILGEVSHGAKLSFSIAGLSFQPSELVKILFVFFLAAVLLRAKNLTVLLFGSLLAAAQVMILVASKDLGAALILFVVYLAMLFVATRKWYILLLGLAGGSGASVLAYYVFPHVRTRVQAFVDPWKYIDTKGYQITQSLFAIGTGNWFGLGIGKGNPGDIPFVETDFIFASICEELGVVFGIMLILVILTSFIMIMRIAVSNKNMYHRLVCTGFGTAYIFQVFLTIGGGIKFIPLTGVTLPLISYGGSSVLVSMLTFFIIIGFSGIEDYEESKLLKSGIFVGILSTGFSVLFLSMCGYLGYFTATQEQEMVNNSYNSRQKLILSKNYRGSIFDKDGVVLAETQIDKNQKEHRVYPYGEMFAHVVGYSTNGRMGVEAQTNYYLINTGISLAAKAANDASGVKNPGNNVYTTLDYELQEAASKAIGVYKGAVVVTECKTGKILALVSKPDFDPNHIEELWDGLVADEESSVLLNRAYQGLYPPGSTFKILTALEYYKEKNGNVKNYSFQCGGSFRYNGNKISCYHGVNHGSVNFVSSFANSCNSSFANIGMQLDRDKFQETLDKMMFNKALPINLTYNQSSCHVNTDLDDEEMMQTSIGQGKTQMTPMHLHMITSAIANKGTLMTPYVIDEIVSADGKIIKDYVDREYAALMTEEEAEFLRNLMVHVVTEGTGRALRVKGLNFTSGGKTGSAEYNNVKGDSHAWFTGFAPAEDPEICVTVIIEGAGSGGDYAAPVAKRVFQTYFEEKEGLVE